jgi:hypothetical protein
LYLGSIFILHNIPALALSNILLPMTIGICSDLTQKRLKFSSPKEIKKKKGQNSTAESYVYFTPTVHLAGYTGPAALGLHAHAESRRVIPDPACAPPSRKPQVTHAPRRLARVVLPRSVSPASLLALLSFFPRRKPRSLASPPGQLPRPSCFCTILRCPALGPTARAPARPDFLQLPHATRPSRSPHARAHPWLPLCLFLSNFQWHRPV